MNKNEIEKYGKAFAEILEILNYLEPEYAEKVSEEYMNIFHTYADKNYKPRIDPSISLEKQNLQRETFVLLSILNLEFWVEDKEEKRKLIKQYERNEKNMP